MFTLTKIVTFYPYYFWQCASARNATSKVDEYVCSATLIYLFVLLINLKAKGKSDEKKKIKKSSKDDFNHYRNDYWMLFNDVFDGIWHLCQCSTNGSALFNSRDKIKELTLSAASVQR